MTVDPHSVEIETSGVDISSENCQVYLGSTSDGVFRNVPSGEWRVAVFTPEHVRAEEENLVVAPPELDGELVPATDFLPPVTGPAWSLTRVVPNPDNGSLMDNTPRRSSSCTPGETTLSIDHRRRSLDTTTVDVTFTFSFDSLPQVVGVGEVLEVPMTLTVGGEHISENAGASAGFLGHRDTLNVVFCSLVGCGGNPNATPEQSGTSRIRFPGAPSDPSSTFEFSAFLNDTTLTVGANCRTRYTYEFVPADN